MDPIPITVLADEAPVGHRSASNDADADVERLPRPPRPETGARAARARAIVRRRPPRVPAMPASSEMSNRTRKDR